MDVNSEIDATFPTGALLLAYDAILLLPCNSIASNQINCSQRKRRGAQLLSMILNDPMRSISLSNPMKYSTMVVFTDRFISKKSFSTPSKSVHPKRKSKT